MRAGRRTRRKPNGAMEAPAVSPTQDQEIAKNGNPASQPIRKASKGVRPYHVAKSPAAPGGANIGKFVLGNARAIVMPQRTAAMYGVDEDKMPPPIAHAVFSLTFLLSACGRQVTGIAVPGASPTPN